MSPKGIKLILAVVLAASLVILVGVTLNVGRTASAPPLTGKLLKRHDKTKVKPTAAQVNLLRGQTLPKEERQVEDKIPKHVPLKVKLRKEKEKAFKDLDNAQWYRDFELEVTNTSDKPIYFLELWLTLPEVKSEHDVQIAFSLRYGRADFIQFETRPIGTDVPIRPGETYTFTIPETDQQGWRCFKARGNADPKKAAIKFIQLSFGDGTGFNGTDALPYPYKRDQSSSAPCRESPRESPLPAKQSTLDASMSIRIRIC